MESKNYRELLKFMTSIMAANQKRITDFNEGSVIMTIFESFARIVENGYIDTRIGYNDMLHQIPYSIFDFEKKSGLKATIDVVFRRNKAVSTETVIPIGTRISDGTHVFELSERAIVRANEIESTIAQAQAEEVGIDYNVNLGVVTTIESAVPSDIVEVRNTSKGIGGVDEESDVDMLARFKDYINGLQGTSDYGLKAGILKLENVRSVGVDEHFPPKFNIYNFTIYIDDGTGHMSESLKESVRSVVDGDGTSNNPGLRACGINCDIQPADIVNVDINLTCFIYRVETNVALAETTEIITNKINSLKIGENVVQTDLVLALRHLSYVKDIAGLKINGESENLAINKSQIARLGNINIDFRSI